MKKNIIKLSEQDIRNIIKESVNKILKENISSEDICSHLASLFHISNVSDPTYYVDDLYGYTKDIAEVDYKTYNNIPNDWLTDEDTLGLHIEDVKPLIEPLRQACMEYLNKQYLELKQQAEDINNKLNICTQCIMCVEQNQDPSSCGR